MNGLILALYALGGFATADGIAYLNEPSHNWQAELFIGITALFIGGMVHLMKKAKG